MFYIDTGLLVSQLGIDVPAKILDSDLGPYKGAVAENMVASAFSKAGKDLYYFRDATGSPELDFLFEKDGNTVIIECKAFNNRATSMKFVLANPKRFGVHPAVKIADTNVGTSNNYDTLPLYSLGFIHQEKKANIVEMVDVTNLRVPE